VLARGLAETRNQPYPVPCAEGCRWEEILNRCLGLATKPCRHESIARDVPIALDMAREGFVKAQLIIYIPDSNQKIFCCCARANLKHGPTCAECFVLLQSGVLFCVKGLVLRPTSRCHSIWQNVPDNFAWTNFRFVLTPPGTWNPPRRKLLIDCIAQTHTHKDKRARWRSPLARTSICPNATKTLTCASTWGVANNASVPGQRGCPI
jgi:hypothetical protein